MSGLIGIKQKTIDIEISFSRKRFRFSDWFAEKAIKSVAFLSIAIVILIFIFVFREAFPIFKIDQNQQVTTEILVQESYGIDENAGTDMGKHIPLIGFIFSFIGVVVVSIMLVFRLRSSGFLSS